MDRTSLISFANGSTRNHDDPRTEKPPCAERANSTLSVTRPRLRACGRGELRVSCTSPRSGCAPQRRRPRVSTATPHNGIVNLLEAVSLSGKSAWFHIHRVRSTRFQQAAELPTNRKDPDSLTRSRSYLGILPLLRRADYALYHSLFASGMSTGRGRTRMAKPASSRFLHGFSPETAHHLR